MRKLYRKHPVVIELLLVAAFMLFFGGVAIAAEIGDSIAANDSVSLFELLAVFLGGEKAAQLVSVIGLACFVFTHIRAWLPASWVAKIPTWLMNRIDNISGNYGGAKNEDNRTSDRSL